MKSNDSFLKSVQQAVRSLDGSYGLGIISPNYPNTIIATRKRFPTYYRSWKGW